MTKQEVSRSLVKTDLSSAWKLGVFFWFTAVTISMSETTGIFQQGSWCTCRALFYLIWTDTEESGISWLKTFHCLTWGNKSEGSTEKRKERKMIWGTCKLQFPWKSCCAAFDPTFLSLFLLFVFLNQTIRDKYRSCTLVIPMSCLWIFFEAL